MCENEIRILGKYFGKCWKEQTVNFEHIRLRPSATLVMQGHAAIVIGTTALI